jgi:diacylglycerol kinase family enzyme
MLDRASTRVSPGPNVHTVDRVLVVANPAATRVRRESVADLVHECAASGVTADFALTRYVGHACELSRAARDSYDLVIGIGGDGTMNELANGLVGSRTALACVPAGLTNVLGRLLGVSGETRDIMRATISGPVRVRRIAIPRVNGRYFLVSASVGLPAAIVRQVRSLRRAKAARDTWAFVSVGIRTFVETYSRQAPTLMVTLGDQRAFGVSAAIQNGSTYTYLFGRPLRLVNDQDLAAVTLSAVLLRRGSIRDLPTGLVRLASGRPLDLHPSVAAFQEREEVHIEVVRGPAAPLEVDGEYVGEFTEFRFVKEELLRVVTPAFQDSPLGGPSKR